MKCVRRSQSGELRSGFGVKKNWLPLILNLKFPIMKYHYPPGYSFIGTYRRALRLVNDSLVSMQESISRFGDTYTVYSGLSRRTIITHAPDHIRYVLKKNHNN